MRNGTKIIVAALAFSLAACDYYVHEINEDFSLCAIDVSSDMQLCRVSDGTLSGTMVGPTVVAFGNNGDWIALKQCAKGVDAYFSVKARQGSKHGELEYTGPVDFDTWISESTADEHRWPPFIKTLRWLEEKHCPEVE